MHKIVSLINFKHAQTFSEVYKAEDICRNFYTAVIIVFSTPASIVQAFFMVDLKEDKTVVLFSKLK